MSQFGYSVMERQEDNESYEVKFNIYNQDAGAMETLDFKLSIPAVRVDAFTVEDHFPRHFCVICVTVVVRSLRRLSGD